MLHQPFLTFIHYGGSEARERGRKIELPSSVFTSIFTFFVRFFSVVINSYSGSKNFFCFFFLVCLHTQAEKESRCRQSMRTRYCQVEKACQSQIDLCLRAISRVTAPVLRDNIQYVQLRFRTEDAHAGEKRSINKNDLLFERTMLPRSVNTVSNACRSQCASYLLRSRRSYPHDFFLSLPPTPPHPPPASRPPPHTCEHLIWEQRLRTDAAIRLLHHSFLLQTGKRRRTKLQKGAERIHLLFLIREGGGWGGSLLKNTQ